MNHNFNDVIDDLKRRTKAGELPRETRMVEIERITEWWFRETGAMPDAKQLESLADLILYEELTDSHPDKVANTEYPFFSEYQLDVRDGRESSVGDAIDNSAADGRKHNPPTRRTRSDYENRSVDRKAKIRNAERKKQYNEFIKTQPVQTYNLRD